MDEITAEQVLAEIAEYGREIQNDVEEAKWAGYKKKLLTLIKWERQRAGAWLTLPRALAFMVRQQRNLVQKLIWNITKGWERSTLVKMCQ